MTDPIKHIIRGSVYRTRKPVDRTGNAILAIAGLIVLALCVFVVGVAAGVI